MANSTDYRVVFTGQDNISSTVNKVKSELDSVGKSAKTATEKIDQQFNRIINSSAPLKRQLRDLQKLMTEMNYKGLGNTDQFTKIAQEAGRIKDAMSDTADAVNRFSNDTMGLQATIQAFQGLASVGSIAAGVMGLFGTKSEDVQRAILKVQSAISILNGVQSIANMLNKDSILMHKLKAIQLKYSTAAQVANTTSTTANTASTVANTAATAANTTATNALNVAKAIGKAIMQDYSGLIILAAAGMTTLAIATSNATDAEEKRNLELKSGKRLAEERGETERKMAQGIANAAASQLATYYSLQRKWEECNGDVKRQEQFMTEYKDEIAKTGFEVNNLTDAENLFVNKTDAVVGAIMARARAQAAYELMVEKMKSSLEKLNERSIQSGAYYRVANNDNITGEEREWLQQQGLGPSIMGAGNYARLSYSDEAIKKVNERRNREAQQREKEWKQYWTDTMNNDTQRLADIAEEAMDEYNDNVGKSGLTPIRKGGSTTSKGRTTQNKPKTTPKTDDKKVKDYNDNSLKDLETRYSNLRDLLSKGLVAEVKVEEAKQELKNLENEISKKKIELGFEIDPKIKLEEETKRKLEEKLSELKQRFDNIDFNPKFSSFDKATGQGQYDTNTLAGIEQQMDFNDALIDKLNELMEKYKELGQEGSDAYQNISSSLAAVTTQQTELASKAAEMNNSQLDFKEKEEAANAYASSIGHLGTMFSSLSGAVEESAAAWMNFAATALNATAQLIPIIRSLVVAKQAEAMASAAAEGAKQSWPMNLVAIASGLAAIAAVFASIPKFAEGGIVGGNSFTGDKVLARLNSGERVFTKKQSDKLTNLLDNGGLGGFLSRVEFVIRGDKLYGVMRNYSKEQSKIGKTTGIL